MPPHSPVNQKLILQEGELAHHAVPTGQTLPGRVRRTASTITAMGGFCVRCAFNPTSDTPCPPLTQAAGLPPQQKQGHGAAAELVRRALQELAGDVLPLTTDPFVQVTEDDRGEPVPSGRVLGTLFGVTLVQARVDAVCTPSPLCPAPRRICRWAIPPYSAAIVGTSVKGILPQVSSRP